MKIFFFLTIGLLVLFFLTQPVFAQPAAIPSDLPVQQSFKRENFLNVIETALTFLQPRILDSHSIKELSLWGLNGLNAIDPAFSVKIENNTLKLYQTQNLIYTSPLPEENDTKSWSKIIVDAWFAAWKASDSLRKTANQDILQSFFDELFDHLDPYSRYIGPSSANNDRNAREGGEANIGITLEKQGKYIVVSAVNTNGPAWPAGINVGQRLYSVNGQNTNNQSVEVVSNWLTGTANSPVTLRLRKPGKHKIETIKLFRESIPPETVFAFSSGNIMILKITSFSTDTAEEISQYLDQASQEMKLTGLILDLRGNRGGVLQQAIASSALLLDHGIAVTTEGRDPESNHIWAVQGGDLTNGVPLAILVDGRTASAAEILAATLADHRRGVVIGSTTLGKGLVQTIAQLPDGGELFVTWSRVIAPLGWPLQGLGVMPQICTSRGEQDLQQQLKALEIGYSSYSATILAARKARYPLSSKEILNIRSGCPAALGTDIDLDVANNFLMDPKAYKAALSLIPEE